MKKIEWIAIDLDGTLIDSTEVLFRVYKNFLKEFGCKGTRKEFNRLNGPKLKEIISFLMKKYSIKEKKSYLINKYTKKMEFEYRNTIKVKNGAKKFLDFLEKNGYKIGLVTSSSKKNTNLVLKRNKLLKYFSIIISGDDVKKSKPNPEIYRLFYKKIRVNKKKILVIEDSRNGYLSAKNANLECIKIKKFSDVIKQLSKTNNVPYEIISSKKIYLKLDRKNENISKKKKIQIDTTWKNEQKKRTVKLFNSKVLNLKSMKKETRKILMNVNFVDYKNIITDRINPSINLNYKQIGISGIITINDGNKIFTLIAKRSKNNTEYPSHLELVPSGNLDESIKDNHGKINYKEKLIEELKEETGICKNNIKDILEIGIVKDNKNSVYDICCLIKISSKKQIIKKQIKKTKEYSKPQFINIEELERRILCNKEKIVPTSLGIIELFLKNIK